MMVKLEKLNKILKALGDPGRVRIIALLLKKKNLCVCEIQDIINLSQPTISFHLKLLENTGIVECQRQGLWANYNIKSNLDYSIKQIINNVVGLLKDDERIIEDRLKVNSVRRKKTYK